VAIDDELWARLDPHAGRLRRSTRRRLWIGLVAVVVLAAFAASAHRSGTFVPRVSTAGWEGRYDLGDDDTSVVGAAPRTDRVYEIFSIANDGTRPFDVVGVGHTGPAGPGAQITATLMGFAHETDNVVSVGGRPVDHDHPFPVPPGEYVPIEIHYRITDCAAVDAGPRPVALRVARPWGLQTVEVLAPPLIARDGGYSVADRGDPRAVESVRYLADHLCGRR
jgi:hypothetical protein